MDAYILILIITNYFYNYCLIFEYNILKIELLLILYRILKFHYIVLKSLSMFIAG